VSLDPHVAERISEELPWDEKTGRHMSFTSKGINKAKDFHDMLGEIVMENGKANVCESYSLTITKK
jgi:hypothetical protein